MGISPPEDFSEDKVNSGYPNIPQGSQGYKKIFDGLHHPEDKKK
jgi:hypothetical protein